MIAIRRNIHWLTEPFRINNHTWIPMVMKSTIYDTCLSITTRKSKTMKSWTHSVFLFSQIFKMIAMVVQSTKYVDEQVEFRKYGYKNLTYFSFQILHRSLDTTVLIDRYMKWAQKKLSFLNLRTSDKNNPSKNIVFRKSTV